MQLLIGQCPRCEKGVCMRKEECKPVEEFFFNDEKKTEEFLHEFRKASMQECLSNGRQWIEWWFLFRKKAVQSRQVLSLLPWHLQTSIRGWSWRCAFWGLEQRLPRQWQGIFSYLSPFDFSLSLPLLPLFIILHPGLRRNTWNVPWREM